jgi:RNA-directed DNA polymerase
MKRVNNLIEQIADPDNLRLAFWKASKGKRHTAEVLAYQRYLEDNLLELRAQILRGSVEVGDYRYFKIFEPKERQICASAFREQVLHHALMNICHDYFERDLIFDSYASRKGKGTHAAIKRAQLYSYQHRFFLKLDVRKFFERIPHDILKGQLARLFKDKVLLSLFNQIIDSYEASPKRGLPISNLTSQYFANHFLSSLDHFIKDQSSIKAYVRYMDDMVLWHDDKVTLKHWRNTIQQFVEQYLGSALKPELLNYTSRGLPFLGYLLFPKQIRLTQHSKQRFIRKANLVESHYHSGEWSENQCQNHILPLLAFLQHADTEGVRRTVLYHGLQSVTL